MSVITGLARYPNRTFLQSFISLKICLIVSKVVEWLVGRVIGL